MNIYANLVVVLLCFCGFLEVNYFLFNVDFQVLGLTWCWRFQRCEVWLLYHFCEFSTFL